MNPRCSVANCEKPPAGLVGARPVCRQHFIAGCYEEIEQCAQQIREQRFNERTTEETWHFLNGCSSQAATLALDGPDLDNLERAQLLDILLWAADLSRRLRRSLREHVSIPVSLRLERPDGGWAEETATRVLSRHGALIECNHPIEIGKTLVVERLDTKRQAQARVVWRQHGKDGCQEVAIEFLDCDNFWDLKGNPFAADS